MSLDKESIDKEVEILGIEAHMFWELPKVREMFNELCKKWFYSDNKSYTHAVIDVSGDQPASTEARTTDAPPLNVIVGSEKEKRHCIELGFVDKLIELWKLRKELLRIKQKLLFLVTLPDTIMMRQGGDEQNGEFQIILYFSSFQIQK